MSVAATLPASELIPTRYSLLSRRRSSFIVSSINASIPSPWIEWLASPGAHKSQKTMSALRCLAGILAACILASHASAQPANDHYTNRIVLTGTDISFSGTLAGATLETPEVQIPGSPFPFHQTQSIWWEWTPAQSTTVIIDVPDHPANGPALDAVAVYRLQNVFTGTFIAGRVTDPYLPHCFFVFSAEAGTNYQIQFAGDSGTTCAFRLIATNLPYIIEQPHTQTVSADDSALFDVVTTGLGPFGYQWQFNGTNLNGETAPMLALKHVTADQAGAYWVVITNSLGATISETAILNVTGSGAAPTLTAAPSGTDEFHFSVQGEIGRRFRIESSADLTLWAPELILPDTFRFGGPFPTSVHFNSTGADLLKAPMSGSQKFFRVKLFHAENEECNVNLKQLRLAQLLWCYDNAQASGMSVTIANLLPYLKDAEFPQCPSAGVYSLTVVSARPSCNYPGHVLEEP
jgi:hypothetical protein